jgi:tetratricopeptide (TPR) repeat protein
MLSRRIVPAAWGPLLAATLVCSATAQTSDFGKRLAAADQLRAQDRFAEARTSYRDLLRDVRAGSPDHRLEGLVLDHLALNEQDSGDYAAAETAFNQGLAAVSAQSAADPVLIALKTHLAEHYIAETRPEDAEPLLRQSLAAMRSNAAPDSVALAIADEDLAVVCIMRRKFDEPEALLRQSQALIENLFGPDNPKLSASLLTFAGFLTAQHRYADALAPAERAWQILYASPTPIPTPYRASAMSVLGVVYYHTGHVDKSVACARQAVDLAEASLGPHHPRLAHYLSNYAAILKWTGHKNEAKAVQKKADEIQEQNPPAGTGYTVNVAALR